MGTLANFVDRATRLYEQERQRRKGPSPLGAYVKNSMRRGDIGWRTIPAGAGGWASFPIEEGGY
jgi:hypothetical protein